MICFNCYNEEDFKYKEEDKKYIIGKEEVTIKVTNTYCSKCNSKVFNSTLDNENLKKAHKKLREKSKKSESDF